MIKSSACRIIFSLGVGMLFSLNVLAQSEENLRRDLTYLASDKLMGRLTGTKYEQKAGKYIAKEFRQAGLKAQGEKGSWFQPFTFHTGYQVQPKGNEMVVGGKKLVLDKDFYPLVFSGNGKTEGNKILRHRLAGDTALYTAAQKELGSNPALRPIILIDLSAPGRDPHNPTPVWRERLMYAQKLQPRAILFYNADNSLSAEAYRRFNNLHQEHDVLLLHVSKEIAQQLLDKPDQGVQISVNLARKEVQGRNVVGMIDNGRPLSIVIGAHYDHLGHDEYGNSLYRGTPDIHNGADDNASGTAALMELARLIKSSQYKNYNFIFVAFSGEELGLLGSNYFTKNCPVPIQSVAAMINMDMVGRLDSQKRDLGIYGTGTSPIWDSLTAAIRPGLFNIKKTASGMGSSDHSSFYLQNIPAIHFFSGNHKDYHKPSDDVSLINFAGLKDITAYILDVVAALDKAPRPLFTKTKEETASTPRFKVTLGIIPDYFYEGGGVRVDGISPGKPAEKAGLKQGDIVLKIDDYVVSDMQTYMETLGKFEKGDKVNVRIRRGQEELTLPVEF